VSSLSARRWRSGPSAVGGQAKLTALQTLLAQFVTVDINDPQVIQAYAQIDTHSQTHGRKMGKNDLWIAATAHVAGASLMSTDSDFDHLVGTHLTLIKIDAKTGTTI
jgi:predicted nucleic acid-binding protein